MQYLTQKQINRIQNDSSVLPRDYLLVKVLLKTGMRVSELCSMLVQDINFEERYIWTKGKGKKNRVINIDTELSQLLRLYISNNKLSVKARLFPITRDRVHKIVKKYDATIYPHMFRHTYAINVLRTTKNIRFLQEQLGHSNLNTTAKYLRYADYDKEKQLLEELYK